MLGLEWSWRHSTSVGYYISFVGLGGIMSLIGPTLPGLADRRVSLLLLCVTFPIRANRCARHRLQVWTRGSD